MITASSDFFLHVPSFVLNFSFRVSPAAFLSPPGSVLCPQLQGRRTEQCLCSCRRDAVQTPWVPAMVSSPPDLCVSRASQPSTLLAATTSRPELLIGTGLPAEPVSTALLAN